MIEVSRPTLFIIAGPNGAGKSTLYELIMRPKIAAPFINADVIQKEELKDDDVKASYKAAQIATQRRDAHISTRKSFITETVFSHPSKIHLVEQAKKAGFRVVLYHVCLASPDLSVLRVKGRMIQGGHAVPDDKIRERYDRNGPIIRDAVLKCDRALIFDNSMIGAPPRRVLAFRNGALDYVDENLPRWAQIIYFEDLRKAATNG